MKSLTVILFLTIIFSANILSQDNPTWVSRYNGTSNGTDETAGLVVDAYGNVYVTGRSQGTGSNYDYVTIKINSSGDTVWVRRYNGPANSIDEAKDITLDNIGNIYVTGMSVNTLAYSDIATIKYNPSGAVLWVTRYDSPGNTNASGSSVVVDENYNVYVTGSSQGTTSGTDYITIKYNSGGTQLWESRYNGLGNHTDNGIKIIYKSGALFVTGLSYNTYNASTSTDIVTIKYNLSGDSVWVKRYNGPGNNYDRVFDIKSDNSGNVYLTGFTRNSTAAESADYVTIKYSPSGDSLWVKRYNGPGNSTDESYSLGVDNSGNVYVTGGSVGSITGYDYATIKYNSTGVEQWVLRYNGTQPSPPPTDLAKALVLDNSGNVYVTGYSQGYGSQADYVTIKYNPSGTEQWLHRYNGTGNNADAAYFITLDNSGYVYVTGNSSNPGFNLDYTTIKYDKISGLQNISGEIPDEFHLYQNYPNPFNPTTKIKFNIPEEGSGHFPIAKANVKLIISDVLGREVTTLMDEQLKPGTYEVEFDGSGFSSGIYYYTLVSASFKETRSMILLK